MLSVRNWSFVAIALLLGLSLTASRVTAKEWKKEKGSISGTVLWLDGKAAIGADVRLKKQGEKPKNKCEKPAAADEDPKPKGDKPTPVASATTDSASKST